MNHSPYQKMHNHSTSRTSRPQRKSHPCKKTKFCVSLAAARLDASNWDKAAISSLAPTRGPVCVGRASPWCDLCKAVCWVVSWRHWVRVRTAVVELCDSWRPEGTARTRREDRFGAQRVLLLGCRLLALSDVCRSRPVLGRFLLRCAVLSGRCEVFPESVCIFLVAPESDSVKNGTNLARLARIIRQTKISRELVSRCTTVDGHD